MSILFAIEPLNKTIIERNLLERLIRRYLLEAAGMDHTIKTCGDHYTYRDLKRMYEYMEQELEREHIALLKYVESTERCREIRRQVAEEALKLYGGSKTV